MKVVGVLLAGGAWRRFGREKAVAAFGSGMLMDGPLQALIGACEEVAISAKEGSAVAAIAKATAFDLLPDPAETATGSLRGMICRLEWAAGRGADALLTAPCDAALLQVDQLDRLIATAQITRRVVVAQSSSGLEPLIAVWPVQTSLTVVRQQLADGAHPALKDVIAMLGYTSVRGFDGVNVNPVTDLRAVEDGALKKMEPADQGRLFAFESEFVRTLRCVPMCVRFKLDQCGIKLTLRQWSRFTLGDREILRTMPCQLESEVATYRSKLEALVLDRSAEKATELKAVPEPVWASLDVPPEIVTFASQRGFHEVSHDEWSRLATLERYALVKLSRDKHENANFEPALREFCVLEQTARPRLPTE